MSSCVPYPNINIKCIALKHIIHNIKQILRSPESRINDAETQEHVKDPQA